MKSADLTQAIKMQPRVLHEDDCFKTSCKICGKKNIVEYFVSGESPKYFYFQRIINGKQELVCNSCFKLLLKTDSFINNILMFLFNLKRRK